MSHGLCKGCYWKKGGVAKSPPSPTAKEVYKFIENKIDIYEKIKLPKTRVLSDIVDLYFEHMGSRADVKKKLISLNVAIDEYLTELINQQG
jgi:hypothetical protein